jgi:alpha-ribazole phosphatase
MLLLVRHGRTAANAEGRLQGRLDLPLDQLGVQQAQRVADAVGAPDLLVVSPLLRARQTADAFGLPYEIDERWVEVSYGEWEGKPLADVPDGAWTTWRADAGYAPPGGESLSEVSSRVRGALADLTERARDELVVIVSHVSPIKAAVAWALDVDVLVAWRCTLGHAAVCEVTITPRGPVLSAFNR